MRILTCLFIAAAGLAAQDPAKTPAAPPRPAAKQAKKTPAVVGIPKDAVETAPGFYKWTDKDGKVWMYRRTPFGVSKRPFEATAYDKRAVVEDHTIAVEQGDSIRFEQSSPFGKRTWVRKKTELTETEQAIWANQQKNKAAGQTAEKE